MDISFKKVLALIVIAFLIFYLLSRPTQLANDLETVGGWFSDAFDQIIKFFEALGDDREGRRERR